MDISAYAQRVNLNENNSKTQPETKTSARFVTESGRDGM